MTFLLALLHSGVAENDESGTFMLPYYVAGSILLVLLALVVALVAFGAGREHS